MLAGAGFTGVWLLPFLRYPSDTPASKACLRPGSA
ncbi:hypothetical protein H4N49_28695 [Streptomyces sp. DHE17-7]|nr:hypothetical protein [Streptomyces sp. DHE17-7]